MMSHELLAEVMIWLMAATSIVAIVAVLWSASLFFLRRGNQGVVVNRVPSRRIVLITVSATLLLLVLSFVFSSSTALTINGEAFTDKFWLHMAGMFIVSCSVMLLMTVIAVCVSLFISERHSKVTPY